MVLFVLTILAIAAVSAHGSCVPGETKTEDCNNCVCVGDGSGFACTRMHCVHPTVAPELVGAGRCEPGKPFKHYCNMCRCPATGLVDSAACTKMYCIEGMFNEDGSLKNPPDASAPRDKRQAQVGESTCEPGKSFKMYCNTCHCPPSGSRASAGCTLMACQPGMWNSDGTLGTPSPILLEP